MIYTRTSFIAMLLIFFSSAAGVVSIIYSNTLFLATYPRSMLPYFLIIQALTTAATTFFVAPMLVNNIKRNALILLGSCIVLIVLSLFLFHLPHHWIPFVVAIIVGLVSAMVTLIGWNLIPLAFGLREYKQVVIYVNQASMVGGILGSLQVPLILKYYSFDALQILLIGFILFFSICVYLLSLTPPQKNLKVIESSPSRYPLYIYFLIFYIGIIITQALADYIFKYELAQHFTKERIGIFMGYFVAITNTLGFVAALLISKKFLQWIRIKGLLEVTPLFTLGCAILVIIFPSLWTVCLLASSKAIFFYNYTRLGTEIVLNILPSAARLKSKAQLKSVVSPLVTVLIFIVLLLVARWMEVREVAVVIAFASVLSIYYIKRISNAYTTVLEQETEFRRFNLIDEMNSANATIFQEMIPRTLQASEDNLILLGLSALKKFKPDQLPESLYQQLQHVNPLIRKEIIKIIKDNKAMTSLPALISQFERETDSETKLLLIDTIVWFDLNTALEIAQRYAKDPENILYPVAMAVFLKDENGTQNAFALNELRRLSRHSDAMVRKEVAYTIANFQIDALEAELSALISDPIDEVSKAAMRAATRTNMISLASIIMDQLLSTKRSYEAHTALVSFGARIVPALLSRLPQVRRKNRLIKVLAEIQGEESEQALVTLAQEGSVFLRSQIAKKMSYCATQRPVGNFLRQIAKEFAREEAYVVAYLEIQATQHIKPFVQNEIASRIKLAKQRALLWIAIATDAQHIIKLIPSLLTSSSSFAYQQANAKALELLEIFIPEMKIKESILSLFEEANKKDLIPRNYVYSDDWLDKIMQWDTHSEEAAEMDVLLKVFDLRAVELFKDLPGEILLAIAEETEVISVNEGDTIFHENDLADGLYCISSGRVKVSRGERVLATLQAHDFFGELALMDDAVRAATVVAETDCTLLFLDKSTFDRITDDLPDVLRAVTRVILRYLRQNMML